MKLLAIIIFFSTLSLVGIAQHYQPALEENPVFPERIDPSTLQRDSLERAPQSAPSNAEIIAEPASDHPPLQLQRDSVIRERKTRRTEKE